MPAARHSILRRWSGLPAARRGDISSARGGGLDRGRRRVERARSRRGRPEAAGSRPGAVAAPSSSSRSRAVALGSSCAIGGALAGVWPSPPSSRRHALTASAVVEDWRIGVETANAVRPLRR